MNIAGPSLPPPPPQPPYFSNISNYEVHHSDTSASAWGDVLLFIWQRRLYLRAYSVEWKGDWWIINLKDFRRNRLWPNRDTIPVFFWRDWGNHRKPNHDSLCSGRGFTRELPTCKSRALPLSQPAQLVRWDFDDNNNIGIAVEGVSVLLVIREVLSSNFPWNRVSWLKFFLGVFGPYKRMNG
jgi:hypothetical protein